MRTLTIGQYARLDRLVDETVVIGWYKDGPLIRYPNTLVRVITPDGRLRAVPHAIAVGSFA